MDMDERMMQIRDQFASLVSERDQMEAHLLDNFDEVLRQSNPELPETRRLSFLQYELMLFGLGILVDEYLKMKIGGTDAPD